MPVHFSNVTIEGDKHIMEAGTPTIDPPAEPTFAQAPAGSPLRAADDPVTPTPALNKVPITLTRIRKVNAAAKALDKAHRTFLAETGELLVGRENDDNNVVGALETAREDFLNGAFAEGAARIGILADEFESMRA